MSQENMKYIVCVLMSIMTFDCFAFDKTLSISDTKNIDYEIPDSWSVLKKQVSKSSPIQMLKIADTDNISLEALFFEPKKDSPLSKMSMTEATSSMQNVVCSQYIKGSVEAKDTRVVHQSDVSSGFLSLYTDKKSFGFKYVTCVTYVLRDSDTGINANITLLSKQKSGKAYDDALKVINSFRVRLKTQ